MSGVFGGVGVRRFRFRIAVFVAAAAARVRRYGDGEEMVTEGEGKAAQGPRAV